MRLWTFRLTAAASIGIIRASPVTVSTPPFEHIMSIPSWGMVMS